MKTNHILCAALSVALLATACNSGTTNTTNEDSNSTATMKDSTVKEGITQADWGTTDGKQVHLFTLTNKNGVKVTISDYGSTITSFVTPDKNGNKSSIIIGFDSLAGYLAKPPYFGATVGRYGNRIAKGKFTLNGTTYTLATNNGQNALHGGLKGFDKQVWTAAALNANTPELTLSYVSKDGEEGYPGTLNASVKFTLTNDDALRLEYTATTDKATPINLTNHSYFNLTGSVSNTILNHTLIIDADHYTPVDTTLIPTGEIKAVKGTPFDFTKAEKVGARIADVPGGYDHNFVLNKKDTSLTKVAELSDDVSGRKVEVFTQEPGLQFYTGNFLDGSIKLNDGKPVIKNAAMCMETQHFPNSPNTPAFPSTILQPGKTYHTVTEYKVSVNK